MNEFQHISNACLFLESITYLLEYTSLAPLLSARHRIKLSHPIFVFIVNMSAILLASLLTSAATAPPAAEHSGSLVEPALHKGIQEVSSGACSSGWVDASFVEMGCLYFNSTEAKTWDDSVISCQMATPNASLVEILTENQMAFVQMEIELLEAHEGKHYWWTGATDVGINGRWFWAPSLSPVEEFMWAPGYPKNDLTSNCMMIHYGLDAGYNQVCDWTSAYPLCQLK